MADQPQSMFMNQNSVTGMQFGPGGALTLSAAAKAKQDADQAARLAEIEGNQQRLTQAPQIQRDIDLGNLAAGTSRDNNTRDNDRALQQSSYDFVTASRANDTNRYGIDVGARTTAEGNRLAADTNRYGVDVGARVTGEGNQLAADTARRGQDTALEAALAPVNFARDKFNSIFPLIQQGATSFTQQNSGLVGGTNVGPKPMGQPVYSDGDVQQQVNAQRATIDQQTGTQQRQNARTASGRGFGQNSPLLMALNQQAASQGQAAGATAEREIRYGAKGANAQQALSYDQLGVQQANYDNQNDIERRKAASQNQAQLLQILAGLT